MCLRHYKHMHSLGISFLSWKNSPSIKYALQIKFQVLTTERRYLVMGTAERLSNMYCTSVYRAKGSDEERKYEHWRLGEGRGRDLLYSSWKLWKIKTSPKISLSVKLRCQSALFSVDESNFCWFTFLTECSLQSKLRGTDFHFLSFAYSDLIVGSWHIW